MNKQPAIRNPKSAFWWGSLRTKIIAWSFVPTAIILLAVALITFYAYQQVTEELVIERDRVTEELVIERNQELTRLSAGQLAAELAGYTDLLAALARTADIYQNDPAVQRDALKGASNRLAVFDAGVLILDTFGTVVAAEPERSEVLGQDWSNRIYYREMLRSQIRGSPRPVFSDIVTDGPGGAEVIVVAVSITGDQGEFVGTMVGMFRLGATAVSAFYGDIVKLRIGGSGSTYLVDGNGRVVYHSDTDRIGKDFGMQAVVRQVLSGQTDAIRTHDFAGNDIVAGFAPVPGTPWGLVTEESWAALTSGSQGYGHLSQLKYLLLLLVPGVVVPALVVAVGVRRITRPVTELIGAAQEVARGNFGQTITAQTGDEIEELARQFNLMSAQLQASYVNLEQRVADRTRELATLNAIAAVVSRSLDLDEILHDALGETLSMLEVESGVIYLMEPDREALTLQVHHGLTEEFVEAVQHVRIGEGITGQAVAKGKPVVLEVPDYARAESSERLAPSVLKEGLQTMASTPLIHKGQALGGLTVGTRRPRAFPPQGLELLTAIGQQIGVAVENARLYEQAQQELSERKRAEEKAQRRAAQAALIYKVSQRVGGELELDTLLSEIVTAVRGAFDYHNVALMLLDEEAECLTLTSIAGGHTDIFPEGLRIAIGEGMIGYAAATGETQVSGDVSKDPHYVRKAEEETRSELAVPIKSGQKVIGVLDIQSGEFDAFDETAMVAIETLSTQIATAIENASLYEAAQRELAERVRAEDELRRVSDERARRNRELVLLNRVIAATTSRLEPKAVLEAVCRELALAFSLPEVGAALLDEGGATLTVVAEYRSEERPSALGAVLPVQGSPSAEYVLEHKAPLAVADAQHDPRMAPVHDLMRQRSAASLLILPLMVHGEVVGTIGLVAVERREFTDEEITLAANAAAASSQALESARAEEALRLTQFTVDRAADAIFWIGPDARFLDVNDAACFALGYSREELLSMTVHDVDPNFPPEAWPDHWSEVQQRGSYTFESHHRTKDGRVFPVEINVNYLEFGGEKYNCAFVRDITERVQAEEKLREAKAAAEEARVAAEAANRAKSTFLANMSHELRTPLNAILGFAQLMTRDTGLTAEQQENLETIGRSGEHLLGLINDVLELSKIEAGRVALYEESFDLHRLLDGLEEMFHLRAVEKGLMLIFDRAPDVPQYVRADEGKLRQVLMNILGNAVKFTREGGVTLQMGYDEGKGDPARLLFEVEDTGPGVARAELDAVFDPFRQTASGQKTQEGTGLGMPISRQFVRLMGGDLTVSSELGVGSLFKFDVQIQLADAADVPTARPTRRVIGLEPDQPVYRLLVAEDREPSRRLLVKLLAPLGFELREAANGQEAIEIWERWKPHLIWMDMRMPVMDGHEATQRIKATTQGQATVIVALTASAFESDRAMILSGGCDDYVRKPFREEEIFDTLAKHLGVRFVYEEGAEPIGITAEAAEGILTTGALAALPADWVASLHQAATQLDADLILALLDQIREQNVPLADALESLVHDFRFDTIMTLTAPQEEGNEQRGN